MIADIRAIHEIYCAPKFVVPGNNRYGRNLATDSEYLDAMYERYFEGENLLIDLTPHGGGTITLHNFNETDLTDAHFAFFTEEMA